MTRLTVVPPAPTAAEATAPLGSEPVAIPVAIAGIVGVVLALAIDLLTGIDWREALVGALLALAPVVGVAVPIARRNAWSKATVRARSIEDRAA